MAAHEQYKSIYERRKISDIDFRPSDVEKKMKHEDPFRFRDKLDTTPKDNSGYIYPFHLP